MSGRAQSVLQGPLRLSGDLVEEWNGEQVFEWAAQQLGLEVAQRLRAEKVNGVALLLLDAEDLQLLGIEERAGEKIMATVSEYLAQKGERAVPGKRAREGLFASFISRIRRATGSHEQMMLSWMLDEEDGKTDVERGVPWETDESAAEYARQVVAAPLRPILANVGEIGDEERLCERHGVQLLELDAALMEDEKWCPHHFSRGCAREIWEPIASWSAESEMLRFDVVVMGTTGVGKTRSITFALKRLLQAGRVVILQLQRERMVYAFVPLGGEQGTAAWKCAMTHFNPNQCRALRDRRTCFIVDSKMDVTAPVGIFAAQRVLVCSAQTIVAENLIAEGAQVRLMPACTREEVLAMWSAWSGPAKLSRREVCTRFRAIGGVPRFIFARARRFDWHVAAVRAGVCRLDPSRLVRLLAGRAGIAEVGHEDGFTTDVIAYEPGPLGAAPRIRLISEYAQLLGVGWVYSRLALGRSVGDFNDLYRTAAIGSLLRRTSFAARRLGAPERSEERLESNHLGLHPVFTSTLEEFEGRASSLPKAKEIGVELSPLYLPPAGRIEQGIDAAGACDRLYIATRVPDCPVKHAAIAPFYRDAGVKVQMVFIVPQALFDSFRAQPIVDCPPSVRRQAHAHVEQLVVALMSP